MSSNGSPKVGEVLAALRRIIRAIDTQSKRLSRDYGVTIPQLIVMQEIEFRESTSAAEISTAVSLSQATVTSILTRLEARDLIVRSRSKRDRRMIELSLTIDGLALLRTSPELLHDKFITEFSKIAPWEQHQILSSILRLAEMMDAPDIDAAPLLAPGELKDANIESFQEESIGGSTTD